MNKKVRRFLVILFAGTLLAGIITGCGKKAETAPPAAPAAEQPVQKSVAMDPGDNEEYEDEEYYEDDGFDEEEYYDEDYLDDEMIDEEADAGEADVPDAGQGGSSNDEIVEMARKHSGAPKAELDQVMDNGHLYIHLFEDMDDHQSTWDWYDIDPNTLKGTNFMGEEVDLNGSGGGSASAEGDSVADGTYNTDMSYKGELSKDGSALTITTALSHYDNNWNEIKDYEKDTYVFGIAPDCKCVFIDETRNEYPLSEKIDDIETFLKGESGLPLTFTVKNGKLTEISVSS